MDRDSWRRSLLAPRNFYLQEALAAVLRMLLSEEVERGVSIKMVDPVRCLAQSLVDRFLLPREFGALLAVRVRSQIEQCESQGLGPNDLGQDSFKGTAAAILEDVTQKEAFFSYALVKPGDETSPSDPADPTDGADLDFERQLSLFYGTPASPEPEVECRWLINGSAIACVRMLAPRSNIIVVTSHAPFALFDDSDWDAWYRGLRNCIRQQFELGRKPKERPESDTRSLAILQLREYHGFSWRKAARQYAEEHSILDSDLDDWIKKAKELQRLLLPKLPVQTPSARPGAKPKVNTLAMEIDYWLRNAGRIYRRATEQTIMSWIESTENKPYEIDKMKHKLDDELSKSPDFQETRDPWDQMFSAMKRMIDDDWSKSPKWQEIKNMLEEELSTLRSLHSNDDLSASS